MKKITYKGTVYACREQETVLDALLRQGADIAFSCRGGTCHSCLQRCISGKPPANAQRGLDAAQRAQNYFLPCTCIPEQDMEIAQPESILQNVKAQVHAKELLTPDICRLLLEPEKILTYHPGQYIKLTGDNGIVRSYSLASVPSDDYFLELHIRRVKGGILSNWIFETLQPNDEIQIEGPYGSCYYRDGSPERPLLLIGTGTGLAPLVGIARDALQRGHTGDIHLYHGGLTASDLYLHQALSNLAQQHRNFHYLGCLGPFGHVFGTATGHPHHIAQNKHPDLRGWSVFIAGNPDFAAQAQDMAQRSGAAPTDIHCDPFESLSCIHSRRGEPCDRLCSECMHATTTSSALAVTLSPDPEMWEALKDGALLNEILADFYGRVYDDPRLLPFFHGITKQRSIEKQFLFLRQYFTGEKVYFGDRPRNAHHWMVISDELFDYREGIMRDCLERHGLPHTLIQRWIAMEETFRPDIVKSAPWNRVMNGVEIPVDGYGETVLEVGSLCDGCNEEITAGTPVRYHLRLGSTYCPRCAHRNLTEETTSALEG